MNFQQLRSVREAVRCGFNLTEVAAMLHTSQPGVSRQIRELEEELGVSIDEESLQLTNGRKRQRVTNLHHHTCKQPQRTPKSGSPSVTVKAR